jgi:hypothetical protein
MTGSQDSNKNEKSVPAKIRDNTCFDDEINLIDYVMVLWKYKHLILAGSVLPALLVGIIFFFWPTDYNVTFIYDVSNTGSRDIADWNLNQTNYDLLVNQFYGEKNIDQIIKKLQEGGLDEYAQVLNSAKISKDLPRYISFEVLPPYPDLSRVQITSTVQLEEIRKLQAISLKMTITARPAESILKISSIIRENFEQAVPTYLIEKELNVAASGLKAEMADIEKNKFYLDLALQTKKLTLEKLKSLKIEPSDRTGVTVIQFNISDKSEFLPMEYQIQAKEYQIAEDEEKIKFNEAKHNYNKNMLEFNGKLSAELQKNGTSFYTIRQFHTFLVGLSNSYESSEVKDYLSYLIKRFENRISDGGPVADRPLIYAVSKGTAKKSAVVFMASLMVSVFAAFLCEGIKKNRSSAS